MPNPVLKPLKRRGGGMCVLLVRKSRLNEMAISKYAVVVFALLVVYLAVQTKGDAGIESRKSVLDTAKAAFTEELETFKSRISSLERTIDEKTRDLSGKDAVIAEREKQINEKSKTIAALQQEIEGLKKKGAAEAEAAKAYAQVKELEKQVEKLEESLRKQKQKGHSLGLRVTEAENKAKVQSSKYEKLEKVVTGQMARIRKAEQALQIAEATMLKAQEEATVKAQELMKVQGSWLPPWFAARLAEFQAFAAAQWEEHGKPAMNIILKKASEHSAAAQEWVKPRVETAKAKWSPTLKKQWQELMVAVAPHVETIKTKAIEGYEVSRDTVSSHLIKAQELLGPYMETVKNLSRPYSDQVLAVAQPHIDKARVFLKPYTKHIARSYKRFLTSARKCHHQLQDSVRKTLKRHKFTAALATRELVWFLASAILTLPVIGLLLFASSILNSSKTIAKPIRSSRTVNTHRKQKRRHVDK